MEKVKRNWKSILFWGSLWGLLEATLGWGLHLIHFKGEALILYPFGLLCMMNVVRDKPSASLCLCVSGVAATIKLVNLWMLPAVPAYWVINPAIAIALEGAVFALYVKFFSATSWSHCLSTFVLVGLSFVVFRAWQYLMHQTTATNPDVSQGFDMAMLATWLWKSAVQTVYVIAIYRWRPSLQLSAKTEPIVQRLAVPTFVLALAATAWIH